jgi:hypothetical protein
MKPTIVSQNGSIRVIGVGRCERDHPRTTLPLNCRANASASAADRNSTTTSLSSRLPVEVSFRAHSRSRNQRRTSSMRLETCPAAILISTAGIFRYSGAANVPGEFLLPVNHLLRELFSPRSFSVENHD